MEPIRFGDTIHVVTRVVGLEARARGRRGLVTWHRRIINQDGQALQEGLAVRVPLLEVNTRGVHLLQDEGDCPKTELATVVVELDTPAEHILDVLGERSDVELNVLEPAVRLTHDLRQVPVGLLVVDAGHQKEIARVVDREEVLDALLDLLDRPIEAERHVSLIPANRVAEEVELGVAAPRQPDGERARAIGRRPPEGRAERPSLVAESTPEDDVVDAESGHDLRQLSDVSEGVGLVSDAHPAAEVGRHAKAELQVANEGFRADEELVGEDIPRAHQDSPRADEPLEALPLFRPDLEIVLDDHHLTVEHKARKLGIALKYVEKPVDETHQANAELLEGKVPCPIPVRVGDDDAHVRNLLSPATLSRIRRYHCRSPSSLLRVDVRYGRSTLSRWEMLSPPRRL